MEILALVAAGVPDPHRAAAAARPAGKRDDAAGHRRHRSAKRRPVVDAVVGAGVIEDRMTPCAGEGRGDARLELQRRLEEEALQRSALRIVVTRLAAWRRESHRLEPPAVIHILRREHYPVSAKRAIFPASALDEQAERVA